MKHLLILLWLAGLVVLAGSAHAVKAPMFPNSDFEKGDLTGWTKTGTAWDWAPDLGYDFGVAPQGRFLALSAAPLSDLTATGVLKSRAFTVPGDGITTATFFMAGNSSPAERVDFKLASNNNVIFSHQMVAASGAMVAVQIGGFAAYAGQSIYIEVVDNSATEWDAVDDFAWEDGTPTPPPTHDLLFPNSNFESGDLTNWTSAAGVAWNPAPTAGYPWGPSPEGDFCACSAFSGDEKLTGTMTSKHFTVAAGKDVIQFYMAGWNDANIRVEFRKASDDSLIVSKRMPATAAAASLVKVAGFGAYAGQAIYIKVIDSNLVSNPVGGWMMVDDFEYGVADQIVQNPDRCFENAGFELGDFTNWTQTGTAFGAAPGGSNGMVGLTEGKFCISSLFGAGATTLKSANFPLKNISIRLWASGVKSDLCVVNLRLAADDSLLASAQMPYTTPAWCGLVLTAPAANLWQPVYLEVKSGASQWIGIDDIRFDPTSVPVELSAFTCD